MKFILINKSKKITQNDKNKKRPKAKHLQKMLKIYIIKQLPMTQKSSLLQEPEVKQKTRLPNKKQSGETSRWHQREDKNKKKRHPAAGTEKKRPAVITRSQTGKESDHRSVSQAFLLSNEYLLFYIWINFRLHT
jgi:hypothetical protein